jgi:hypothetical protein
MTEIFKNLLFLGGVGDVNPKFIEYHHITTIINVAKECNYILNTVDVDMDAGADVPMDVGTSVYRCVDAPMDVPTSNTINVSNAVRVFKYDIEDTFTDISMYFNIIPYLIKQQMTVGPVLIHCKVGLSRSATMVMAYLIMEHRMSVCGALAFIRLNRSILPNPHFMYDLMNLESQLWGTSSFTNQIDDYICDYILCYVRLPEYLYFDVKSKYLSLDKDYVQTINNLVQIGQNIAYICNLPKN